jgi:PAS domain S-box-containing protein
MINSAELLAENYRLKQRIAELEHHQTLLRLDTFQKTLEVFLKHHTLCETLNIILKEAALMISADDAFIYLKGSDPDTLELQSSYGQSLPNLNTHMTINRGIIGKIWKTQKRVINLPLEDIGHPLKNVNPQQFLALFPMKSNRAIFGVIGFAYQNPDTLLDPDFLNILESFVNLATIASENEQVKDALNNSRSLVHRITETAPDIVFIHDIEHNELVYLNAAFTRILGYPISDFVAQPIKYVLAIVHPEDRSLIGDEYRNLARGVHDYHEFIYRMKDSDGNWHWFAARYQIFAHDNGKPNQILGFLLDITDRRQADVQRIALQMERDRVKLLRDFVRDASHSFRTPLATINTSVYIMRRVDTPENREKHLDLIKRQVTVLDQLVDALLMMSRLDSGVSLSLHMIDLSALLHEIYHDMLMYDNQFDIVLSIRGELDWLLCDRYWMYKALSEIVQNSLQHARERIVIHAYQQSSTIHIHIEDDGEGIEPSEINHIFDRFYRGEKSGIRGGLGLGLSIARKVVHEHSGQISIRSELGKGTVCEITLPLSEIIN